MKTMSDGAKKALKIGIIAALIISLLLEVYAIRNAPAFNTAWSVVDMLGLAAALYYCIRGYRKDAAKFYKLFVYLYILSRLMGVAFFAGKGNVLDTVCMAVVIGAAGILAVAKDLGKTKSQMLGLAILLASFIPTIINFIHGAIIRSLSGCISFCVVAILLNLLVLAKYEDKAERGTT